MLKEDGYQGVFERITNNHSLSQLQQQMQSKGIQEDEVEMSVHLPYVEGTSKKLQHILRSHKIRSIFYTENILCKILCKPKDRVATEDINNVVYKIDCSNCEAVNFSKSKWFLTSRSDEHKKCVNNCDSGKPDCGTNFSLTLTLAGIRRKLFISKAG